MNPRSPTMMQLTVSAVTTCSVDHGKGPDTKACFDADTPHVRKALANNMLDPRNTELRA